MAYGAGTMKPGAHRLAGAEWERAAKIPHERKRRRKRKLTRDQELALLGAHGLAVIVKPRAEGGDGGR